MKKLKDEKFRKRIRKDQLTYKKLRGKAYKELEVLEEYFSKWQTDQEKISREILKHLESHQKELSYSGFRGVLLGIVTSVFVYIFNTGLISPLLKTKLLNDNWALYLGYALGIAIIGFLYFILYFIGAAQFFWKDFKVREQIYINEYMIKITQEKLERLKLKTF